jgi:hypothetical protein
MSGVKVPVTIYTDVTDKVVVRNGKIYLVKII